MNLPTATDVLLTGGSAGGVGALNNADYVGYLVKQVAPKANYRGNFILI